MYEMQQEPLAQPPVTITLNKHKKKKKKKKQEANVGTSSKAQARTTFMKDIITLPFLSLEDCEKMDDASWIKKLELVGQICENNSNIYVKKWEQFNTMLNDVKGVKQYTAMQHKLIARMEKKIKSHSAFAQFQKMNKQKIRLTVREKFDMDNKVKKAKDSLPKKYLYQPDHANMFFVTVDLKRANYNAVKLINPDLVMNTETWEQMVQQIQTSSKTLSKHELFQKSKQLRQILFGKLASKQIDSIQTEMIYAIYHLLKHNEEQVEGCIVSYSFFSKDELVIQFARDNQWRQMYNWAVESLQSCKNYIDISVFKLEKKSIDDIDFYVRAHFTGERVIKCIPATKKLSAIEKTTLNPDNKDICWTFDSFTHDGTNTLVNALKRMEGLQSEMQDVQISFDEKTKRWTISGREPKRLLQVKQTLITEMIDTIYKRHWDERVICFIGASKAVRLVEFKAYNTMIKDVHCNDRFLIRESRNKNPMIYHPPKSSARIWNRHLVLLQNKVAEMILDSIKGYQNVKISLSLGTLSVLKKYSRYIQHQSASIDSSSLHNWLACNQQNIILDFNTQNVPHQVEAKLHRIMINSMNAHYIPREVGNNYTIIVLDTKTKEQLHFDVVVKDTISDHPHLSKTELIADRSRYEPKKNIVFDLSKLNQEGFSMDCRIRCFELPDTVVLSTTDMKHFISSLVFNNNTAQFQLTTSDEYEQTHLTYTDEEKRFVIKKAHPWDSGAYYVFDFNGRRFYMLRHGTIVIELFTGMTTHLPNVDSDQFVGANLQHDLTDILECSEHILSLINQAID